VLSVRDVKVPHPVLLLPPPLLLLLLQQADIASTGVKYAAVQGLKAYLAGLIEAF
jgi:hypothetical protein